MLVGRNTWQSRYDYIEEELRLNVKAKRGEARCVYFLIHFFGSFRNVNFLVGGGSAVGTCVSRV